MLSSENNTCGVATPERSGISLLRWWSYVRSRVWLVVGIICLTETAIIVAGVLTTTAFRAEAFVKLGQVDEIKGLAGLALDKARGRLVALPVLLAPRPEGGTVMITASGETPEDAVAAAHKAAEILIGESRALIEQHVKYRQDQLAFREDLLAKIDAQITSLTESGERDGRNSTTFLLLSTSSALSHLLEMRNKTHLDLIQGKINLQRDFPMPLMLDGPRTRPQQTNPRWGRNLTLGILFGGLFGFFVVGLLGAFRQLVEPPSE